MSAASGRVRATSIAHAPRNVTLPQSGHSSMAPWGERSSDRERALTPRLPRAASATPRPAGSGIRSRPAPLVRARSRVERAGRARPLARGTVPPPQRAWSRHPSSTSRSEEHTSELQSRVDLVCRLLLEKKKKRDRSGGALARDREKQLAS